MAPRSITETLLVTLRADERWPDFIAEVWSTAARPELSQPWSDGRVGMIGASYAAQVQWLAAAERHPSLDALIPIVSGTDPFCDTPTGSSGCRYRVSFRTTGTSGR